MVVNAINVSLCGFFFQLIHSSEAYMPYAPGFVVSSSKDRFKMIYVIQTLKKTEIRIRHFNMNSQSLL